MSGSVFELEHNLMDRCREALRCADPDETHARLQELVGAYAKLLRQTEKITKVGDSIQRKLVKAHEEIRGQHERLQNAQRQLLHREKMMAMNTFVHGLAHEICNPLNFINNFAGLNLELCADIRHNLSCLAAPGVLPATEAQLEDLERGASLIQDHGRRAAAIVDSMSRLIGATRQGQKPVQPQDLSYLLHSFALPVIRRFEEPLQFRLVVHEQLATSLAPVAIQVEDIGTVFTQLTTNACEALLARFQDERSFEPTLSLSTEAIGNHLLVHVDDNGEGVAPSNRDKIFTPFFTTRAKAHNIGLGLTTSYDILVHGYDGDLRLETGPSGCTRFTAELPLES